MNIHNKWTALFLSNFTGVFNDNFVKNCIIFISIGWVLPHWLTQSQLISMVSASLVVPYLFLSPVAGRLSVIYSKKRVFRMGKLLELPVLGLTCMAFYFHWVMIAVIAVFLMGILSCLYSPAKYSLIRDIGGPEGVSFGSGVFEMMAFLGILTGTVIAAVVSDFYNQWITFGIFMGLGLAGYLLTKTIKAEELPEETEENGTLNPLTFLIKSWKFARQHTGVNSAVFGASAFWLIGGMLQMNLVIHSRIVYGVTNRTTGMTMAFAALGIAIGCWIAGKISGKEVKKGLILIGLAGMILLLSMITFLQLNFPLYCVAVSGVALMGGLFQVPCLSMLQNAGLGRKLGDMIAYLNLVTFIFVLLGTLFFSVTTWLTNENSFAVFGVILSVCVLVAAYFAFGSKTYVEETKRLLKIKDRNVQKLK